MDIQHVDFPELSLQVETIKETEYQRNIYVRFDDTYHFPS